MNVAHVDEVVVALRAPRAPRGAKRVARAFVDALSRICTIDSRPTRRERRRVDALLAEAVELLRGSLARELRTARQRAGAGRATLARKLGVTASWVARAERAEASFDVECWRRARALGRSR